MCVDARHLAKTMRQGSFLSMFAEVLRWLGTLWNRKTGNREYQERKEMKNKKKTEFEDSLIATVCKVIHDFLHEVLIFLGHNFRHHSIIKDPKAAHTRAF